LIIFPIIITRHQLDCDDNNDKNFVNGREEDARDDDGISKREHQSKRQQKSNENRKSLLLQPTSSNLKEHTANCH
jgi:hypothetical protein